jgi:hypothetical protein
LAPIEASAAGVFLRVDAFFEAELRSVAAFFYLCDLPPLLSLGARRFAWLVSWLRAALFSPPASTESSTIAAMSPMSFSCSLCIAESSICILAAYPIEDLSTALEARFTRVLASFFGFCFFTF